MKIKYEKEGFLVEDHFQSTFESMNTLERKNFDIVSSENGDLFNFSFVSDDIISNILSVKSKLNPIITCSQNPDFLISNHSASQEIIKKFDDSLLKLSLWICDAPLNAFLEKIRAVPAKNKQILLRFLNLILISIQK